MTQEAQQATLLDAIALAVAEKISTKAVSATASAYNLHGPNSLLGILGMGPSITNAMVMPRTGLANRLPVMMSNLELGMHTIMTGQTASTGSEPTAQCTDCAQPGQLKICNQVWPFGYQCMDSQVLDITKSNRLINRGEFFDQTLVGNPLSGPGVAKPFAPWNVENALKDDASKKLFELQTDFIRRYAHLTWDGNPANTIASTGGYIEAYGLNSIINNTYEDAITRQLCAAANSTIVSLANLTVEANSSYVVTALVETVYAMRLLSVQTGLDPVEFGLAMTTNRFRALATVWPCVYNTYRCTNVATGSTQFIDGAAQNRMRDDMLNGIFADNNVGAYLLMDGSPVPVILDDTIKEVATNGQFVSDMYLIPLNSPKFTNTDGHITYIEAFNWNAPGAAVDMAAKMMPRGFVDTIQNGRYLFIYSPPTKTCAQVSLIKKERIIMEAPFLAARFTGLSNTAFNHGRSFDPNNAYSYFQNGGAYLFTAPSFWGPVNVA